MIGSAAARGASRTRVRLGARAPQVRRYAGPVAGIIVVAVAPLLVATWVFGRSFDRAEIGRADLRLAASLRASRDVLDGLSADAAAWAARAAASPRLPAELRAPGASASVATAEHGLLRLRVVPAGGAAAAGGPAIRRSVVVRDGSRVLGTVVGEVPLDQALVADLARRLRLPGDVRLAVVRHGRVLAGFGLGARLGSAPGAADARVAGETYRTAAVAVAPGQGISLAALTSRAPLDAVVRRREEWVLAAGFATIVTALLLVSLVRRGRGLHWPSGAQRQIHSLALVGDAFAATRDAAALYPVILRSAVAASRATGGALFWNGAEVASTGVRTGRNEETFALRNESGTGELVLSAPAGGFRNSDRELVHSLVRQAEVALESARLHRIVQQQAVTDELTGLANRRRFQEALQAEIRRARRFGGAVGLLLVDLDGFKEINDRFGHEAGDHVLVATAETLRRRIRDTDVVARIGGDEFALLLPHTTLQGSVAVAEDVRAAIEAATTESIPSNVTASIGVAAYPGALTERGLVNAADRALYDAKARGRNRVAMHDVHA